MFRDLSLWLAVIPGASLLGCSGSDGTGLGSIGGSTSLGGTISTGGTAAIVGTTSTAGTKATGGTTGTGGTKASGGTTSSGGQVSTGGTNAQGGNAGTGGLISTGGAVNTGGQIAVGGASATGGSVGTGGTTANAGATSTGGTPGSCSSPTIRITEVDVGATVVNNEIDETTTTNLMVIALSPIASGGSRLMWHGSDGNIHVTTLNADDTINASAGTVSLPGEDAEDIYADNTGGVVLLTRDAQGSGTTHCGNISNLCGATSSLPTTIPCYDMYLVRFDGTSETWATKLTVSTASEPPYLTSPTDSTWVEFIWWYAHAGRIVSDGTNYAAYFGSAVSVSQTCVDATSALATGVNIHLGDRMQVVGPAGALLTGHNSFSWGCSHSWYERIVWDPVANKFAMTPASARTEPSPRGSSITTTPAAQPSRRATTFPTSTLSFIPPSRPCARVLIDRSPRRPITSRGNRSWMN